MTHAKLWAALAAGATATLVAIPLDSVPTWAVALVTGALAALGVWRGPANKPTAGGTDLPR